MIHMNEALIVEGRYDKSKLSALTDAIIVTTNGFGIYKDAEKRDFIRKLAKERGIEVTFEGADLGDVHPNTVRIIAQTTDGTLTTLTGSSVGGGEIEIVDINGTPAKFSGRYPAVVINHIDRLGIISHITSILAINQINIVTVVNSRDSTGKKAVTMIETETLVDTSVKKELESMSAVESVVTMEKVS